MASHWTLTVLDDQGVPEMVLTLLEPTCHIGRDPENELQLDRESISGRHARFSRDPDGDWWVEDLNSTNGIWKDNEEIKGMHRLSEGEMLEIGVVRVRLNRVEDDPKEQPKPPSSAESRRIVLDEENHVAGEKSDEPTVIKMPGDSLKLDWDDEEMRRRAAAAAAAAEADQSGKEQGDRPEVAEPVKKKAPKKSSASSEKSPKEPAVDAAPDSEVADASSSNPPAEPTSKDPEPEKEKPEDTPPPTAEEDVPDEQPVEDPAPVEEEELMEDQPEVSKPRKLIGAFFNEMRDPSTPLAEKLERLLDVAMDGIEIVHRFLAHWLPIIIGWCVHTFCRLPIPARFTVGFGLMALTAALAGWVTLPRYFIKFEFTEEHMEILTKEGFVALHGRLIQMMRYLTVLSAGAAAYAWVKKPRTLYVFKAVLALQTLFWIYTFSFFTRVPSFLNGIDHKGYDKYIRNEHWMNTWTPWTLVMIVPLLLMLGTALRSVYSLYVPVAEEEEEEPEEDPLMGDQVVENLRTGGVDPRMRSSNYWASFVFFSVLAFPFLMGTCGWEKPYGLPKGSGEPVVEMVKVKKKKKKPQKRMIVNNWSPYIFERMKIDDIKVLEELDEQSMDTYEIMQEKSGKLGKGGGKKGGWPEGMEGTVVRFIRLKYKGGDWDQGMKQGSDINLLNRFNQITGFPVAKESEAKTVSRLKRFPKGRKPPFVYLTGKRGLSFSSQEIKTLKWYTLEEGGMLFIDDGGPGFGRQVDNLMLRLYPGNPMVDIPNDDPIFQAPFVFPNGAPPLWQHSGSRARGIRHNGRWVVFFHPGDIGDAWVNNGNEVKPEIAEQAYRLGINVMYYAFNRYYEQHFE